MAVKNRLQILIAERSTYEQKRITVKQIAEHLGISPSALHAWKNNEINQFDGEILEGLCEFFGVGIEQLLYIDKSVKRNPTPRDRRKARDESGGD
jgi:transcriptional regulator with XRE-family HTH domain